VRGAAVRNARCFISEPSGHCIYDKGETTSPGHDDGGVTMSFIDKVKNKADELSGKAKQGIGDATNNESMVAEGQAQETAAHAKQAGEHVKDAGDDVRDAFS
jgi:uncharacterized protein YjbJ (UPF0337 family)